MNKRTTNLGSLKKTIAPILRKGGVVRAGIFGSYARGEAKKNSDVDLLIRYKGNKSLFDLVDLEQKLGKAVNKKIDLLTYNSLHPQLKNDILREEVRIL